MTDVREAAGAGHEDWRFDALLAVLAVLLVLVPYVFLARLFGQITEPSTLTAAFVTGLVMLTPVALRRRPLLMTGIAAVGAVAQLISVPEPTASIIVVPFCAYQVARRVDGPAARTVIALGAIGAVAGPVRWIVGQFGLDMTVAIATALTSMVCFGLVITPYAIGRRARDAELARQAQAAAEAERVRIALSEREQRALAAEETVRNRIARDLHDVVAHSISVMVVQADGGLAMAASDPPAATQALTTIAETGREALGEMRRLVSVLRGVGEEQPYAPSPTLADLPEMIGRSGARLETDGIPVRLPATVELTVYRVVQEALTNALKHAGPESNPLVRLEYGDRRLTITVSDSGADRVAVDDGAGNGLRGMRERVVALGGTFDAGPLPQRGFRVRAELPWGTGGSDG